MRIIFSRFIIMCWQNIDGRKNMDYKKMIVELLDKVQSEYTLKRVYKLLEYLYIREEN